MPRNVWAEIDAIKKKLLHLENVRLTTIRGGVPTAAHASTHSDGGEDEVDVTDLAGFPGGGTTFLRDDGTFAAATAGAHAATHEVGGGDEVDVTQLDGFPGGSPVTYLDSDGQFSNPGGSGDVTGPASSTDNAVPRFNGTGGKTIENTGVTIDDEDFLVPNGLHIPLHDAGNSGTSKTIDWDDGNEQILTLTGNVTLTLDNPRDGGRYVLVIATGAGSFTVTWPDEVLWPSGTAPTITTDASKYDLITLICLESTSPRIYLGSFNQDY